MAFITKDGSRLGAHSNTATKKRSFLQHVASAYPGLDENEREPAVRAVFALLTRHVTPGEIKHVRDQLPAEVRSLWEVPTE